MPQHPSQGRVNSRWMLVLGDAHADNPDKHNALHRAYADADASVALQLGDLITYDLPIETYFIAGNNEDFDVIEALRAGESPDGISNAHLIASTAHRVGGLTVSGLSGNYAPTRYNYDRHELSGDRRRHFTHEDIEAAMDLEGTDIDVFLMHEAPHGLITTEDYDVGCKYVDELLRRLEPAVCLVGHHHVGAEARFGKTRVIALEPAWESYYTLDPETLRLTRHDTPDTGSKM